MKQSATATSARGRKAKTDNGASQRKAGNRSSSGNGSGNKSQSGNRSQSGNGAGSRSSSDGHQSSKIRQSAEDNMTGQSRSGRGQSAGSRQERPDSSARNSGRSDNGHTGHSSSGGTRSMNRGYEMTFQGASHLEKFFLDQLQDIYYAEQKITQSLPKMEEAATTDELKEAFDDHLHQTQKHVKRLEKVFELLGKKAEGKKCEAIEGIAREVETIISETEEGTMTRDAALIMAAQKVEHYEIATYGGLVQLAITIGVDEAADLLDRTLMEEEDTDALLTEIAECNVNLGAELESQMDGLDQDEENKGQENEEGEGDGMESATEE